MSTAWICVTCGNEYPPGPTPDACLICDDERQYVPAEGQLWAPLDPGESRSVTVRNPEPGLTEFTVDPAVGIGQRTFLVQTPAGNVLWEPPGFIGPALVRELHAAGPICAIVSSHPHLVGASVSLSHLLGDPPVYVNGLDRRWITRPDPVIEFWDDTLDLAPGVSLHRCGGHFPGSCVLHVAHGAGGRGLLLTGDTMMVSPDRASVSFMRSYPNLIPLSPRLVRQIVAAVGTLTFDRVYGAFGNVIDSGADQAVRASAERYIGWLTDRIRDPDEPEPS